MPEQGGVVSQQVFLHARELGQPERQAAVVAEGAKVAEVVRDALALEQQRAQPERPCGHFARRGCLQRHGIRPGKCHAAVAGDARGEPSPFLQRQRFEAFLDAFMRVPEALFQPQDALADHREAEMPGLDDAGMHRTDGDLVHPLALDRNEGIAWIARREARVERHVAAQGESVLAPCPMPQPAARVAHSSAQPHQIRDRALHPARGRKDDRNIRIGLAIQTNIDANQPLESHPDRGQHKSRAANDTPSESSSTGAAQGWTAMVVVRMRNSLANTPKGGMPRMATVPSINPHPTVGVTWANPRMFSMSWVPVCCAACPAVKKMALLVSECTVMWSSPAKLATGPPMPKANVINPMCSIEE